MEVLTQICYRISDDVLLVLSRTRFWDSLIRNSDLDERDDQKLLIARCIHPLTGFEDAIREGYTEVVRLLLWHGLPVPCDRDLSQARVLGRTEIEHLLLEDGRS